MTAHISECFLSHSKQTYGGFDWQFILNVLEFCIHDDTRLSGKSLAFRFERPDKAKMFDKARMKLIRHGTHIFTELDDFFMHFAHCSSRRPPLYGYFLIDLDGETRQSLGDVVVQFTCKPGSLRFLRL